MPTKSAQVWLDQLTAELDEDAVERVELFETALPWLKFLVEVREGAAGDWKADAACAGEDVNLFFPERGDSLDPARELCAACPVIDQCEQWVLDRGPEQHGFAADLSPTDRAKLRKVARAA